jgi:hypothetical protein
MKVFLGWYECIRFRSLAVSAISLMLAILAACGGGSTNGGGGGGGGGGQNVSISLAPAPTFVDVFTSHQFSATVTGDPNHRGVNWAVDNVANGNASVGTISATGVYTPPAAPGSHTIKATSVADTTKSASISLAVVEFGVYTYHNNLARDGTNTHESSLTPAKVGDITKFGLLFTCAVDGAVYTQPLWAPNVNIGGTPHHTIFVATEHDSVYAFDAESSPCETRWQISLLEANEIPFQNSDFGGPFFDIQPEIGVTGTPVIDPSTNTLYVVSKSKKTTDSSFHTRLHALSLSDGSEKFGGPVEVSASVAGTGDGTSGGNVAFLNERENQRSALALVNGMLYIAWAAHEDIDPYHGWVMKFDPATLSRLAVFNATPNASRGGIWMGGGGPVADASGNIYLSTGNGTFDANRSSAPNTDYGDTVLKLSTSSLTVNDWFTPFDQAMLETNDADLASGGMLLLPDQSSGPAHLLVVTGKEGTIYLLNRESMGHYCNVCASDTNALQTFDGVSASFGTPAFWQNGLYVGNIGYFLSRYAFTAGSATPFNPTPTSQSNNAFGFPGATPSISSQGATNGIVWAINSHDYGPPHPTGPGPAILYAYDANNLATKLWDSTMAAANRDQAGDAVKFTVPTVANGKVYIGTRTEIDVYGLLP